MSTKKRTLDDNASSQKKKKPKISKDEKKSPITNVPLTSSLVTDEVDFPRGGGTSFTPLEAKAIRTEALKEANQELFEDKSKKPGSSKKKDKKAEGSAGNEKKEKLRIEHLNYKRVNVGLKILGQVISVQPLALIISLPNQLLGHVPITQISTEFTGLLEALDDNELMDDSQSDQDSETKPITPDLAEIFAPGQFVRTVVTAVHTPGTTDMTCLGKTRDEVSRASRRVELSLLPEKINTNVKPSDLLPGFTLSASVKAVEDHGYTLNLGLHNIIGFLSFEDAKNLELGEQKLTVGRVVNVTVNKMADNGRICNVSADPKTFSTSVLTEVTNATSVLPGTLVQCLVTAVSSSGVNLQVLGFFDGTIDEFQLSTVKPLKIGKKIKARVLYDYSTSPPRFAMSTKKHVIHLRSRFVEDESDETGESLLEDAYPIGKVLESVKVLSVEPERGLIVEVQPGLCGFVHISQASDDHVPTISTNSGAWKLGTLHRARVTGYFHLDGLLQLSLKSSILEQKVMRVRDLTVGELVKGTIKKLGDSGLIVSISGKMDGIIWPNHYADITLKHPAKRFKTGASIKCRILSVDVARNRFSLSAKKSLIDSALPIISSFETAKIGIAAHAVVIKVEETKLIVEFYNGLKAIVPAREVGETKVNDLANAFPVGRVVKVRIISKDSENLRIVASIRQAASNFAATNLDISGVEIGDVVAGSIVEIHKDNVVLLLETTQIKALISLKNLANNRKLSPTDLRTSLNVGDKLDNLIVVTRDPEKGLVIVACQPKIKIKEKSTFKAPLSLDTVQVGQIVGGRVTRHTQNGTVVKLTTRIRGILHPTDTSDDYDNGNHFPTTDTILKAAVIGVNKEKNQLSLSTRQSRMYPDQVRPVVDREVVSVSDLQVGESIRGFVKSIVDHGLFVSLGRSVDARVQIKELFDEFVKDWKPRFAVNQVVKGRILSTDIEKGQTEMTLRSGDLFKKSSNSRTLFDLNEGQRVDGRVRKVEDFGLFIDIDDSKLSGLCHKSELSDNKDADVKAALSGFKPGDRVRAVLLSVDVQARRISLGLKPSYFADEDLEAMEEEDGRQSEPGSIKRADRGGHDVPEQSSDDAESVQDVAGESDDDDDDADAMEIDLGLQSSIFAQPKQTKVIPIQPSSAPALQLQGFQWTGNTLSAAKNDDSGSSSDENMGEEQSSKRKRRRKQIELDLTADMHTKTPESNADFERLLLGSPNSSYLWVQYMSFQLQLSEVEKAREIGKRGLQTINFREEGEKLNVWIALLNIENAYGTDDSLEATFKDAVKHNDSKTIHLRLAAIFEQTDKREKAEAQYRRTCKKFGQSSKVWTLFGEYYFKANELEEARKLLPRSLQSLEKRKHIKTITKFAQLEYKFGEAERGKTIFEGIVDSHPKRWDLWSIYIDMEAGQGELQHIRNLYDRVLAFKMTSHKAKSFFKKWLALERKNGNEEGAEIVKQKAVEWTQRASKES